MRSGGNTFLIFVQASKLETPVRLLSGFMVLSAANVYEAMGKTYVRAVERWNIMEVAIYGLAVPGHAWKDLYNLIELIEEEGIKTQWTKLLNFIALARFK